MLARAEGRQKIHRGLEDYSYVHNFGKLDCVAEKKSRGLEGRINIFPLYSLLSTKSIFLMYKLHSREDVTIFGLVESIRKS